VRRVVFGDLTVGQAGKVGGRMCEPPVPDPAARLRIDRLYKRQVHIALGEERILLPGHFHRLPHAPLPGAPAAIDASTGTSAPGPNTRWHKRSKPTARTLRFLSRGSERASAAKLPWPGG
jgi:hypothetical protein